MDAHRNPIFRPKQTNNQTHIDDLVGVDDDWVVPYLEVSDQKKRRGVVLSVAHRVARLQFESGGDVVQMEVDNLAPVKPAKNDRIYVIRGDHKGEIGMLLNIEGQDGIVRTPEWNILSIDTLCKYSPPE